MWIREPEVVILINAGFGNPIFLPDTELEPDIVATSDLAAASANSDGLLLVVPSISPACRRRPKYGSPTWNAARHLL